SDRRRTIRPTSPEIDCFLHPTETWSFQCGFGRDNADSQPTGTFTMSQTGYDYAPKGKPKPVCQPGEFVFAAVALDHGHINGQCNGLVEAGGELPLVFDPDPLKVETFRKNFPDVQVARSLGEILGDPKVHLVAAAAVPSERGPLGT